MYKYIEYLELIGITSYGSRQCASNEVNDLVYRLVWEPDI